MCDLNASLANVSDADEEVQAVQRIAYGYISPVIITFGVVGDFLTMLILLQPPLRKANVIYMYLSFLAVTDLCTLFSVIPLLLSLLRIKSCSYIAAVYYAHIGFPLVNAFMGASVWIVVFFTLSQFVGVCYPFKYTFKRRRVCIYLTILGYIISFGLHIPWAFKNSVLRNNASDTCEYVSCENRELLSTKWYMAYQWIREIISRLLPFCLIAYFNCRILYTYQKSKLSTGTVSVTTNNGTVSQRTNTEIRRNRRIDAVEDKGKREERRLTLLLMGIMLSFFFCTIPAAPLTILVKEAWAKNYTFQVFRALINTLEFTKFALNFYFYCMVNPDLRRLTVLRLTCQPYKKGPMIGMRPSAMGSTALTASIQSQLIKNRLSKSDGTPEKLKPLLSAPTARNSADGNVCMKRALSEGQGPLNPPENQCTSTYSLVYLHHETDTYL